VGLNFIDRKSYLILYDLIAKELCRCETIILLVSNKGVILSAIGSLNKSVRVPERKTVLCQ
jgi:hypothetical protein